jgi:Zn-finger nucleic acid-binding protein
MDQGNYPSSQHQQANQQTATNQTTDLKDAVERILSVASDASVDDKVRYLEEATRLRELANLAEELKPILAPLNEKGAISLKVANASNLDNHVEAILEPRGILNQLIGKESKKAQEGARKLGIKLEKGKKGHSEAVRKATVIGQELKHFNDLEEKVSPKISSESFVTRLKEKVISFKDGIIFYIRSLEEKNRRQEIYIAELEGRDPPPITPPITPPHPSSSPPPADESENWKRNIKRSTRNCPINKGNMLEVTYGGVVLDVSAKGVWFDYGELRAILGEDDDKRKFAATTIRENQNIDSNPYILTLKHFVQQLNGRHDEEDKNNKAQIDSATRAAKSTSQHERETAVKDVLKLIEKKKALESEGFTFLEGNKPPGGVFASPPPGGGGPATPPGATTPTTPGFTTPTTPGATTPTTPGFTTPTTPGFTTPTTPGFTTPTTPGATTPTTPTTPGATTPTTPGVTTPTTPGATTPTTPGATTPTTPGATTPDSQGTFTGQK